MIQVTYQGVDITENISINRCYHDMYAAGCSDTLRLRVNDAQSIWDAWAPKNGDEIRVDYGTISTGVMFVTQAIPSNGFFDIFAQAAPKSGYDPRSKAWQNVRFLQLGADIAERNGLSFASYGVEDRLYPYILQNNEGDFEFLHHRAALEGCSFLVYDKTLILYSEAYMEAVEPSEALEITESVDFQYIDGRSKMYGSCTVTSGLYNGEFKVENGSSRVYRPIVPNGVSSDAEADRFAKNLLRFANKGCCGGYIRANILPGYAAASTVMLSNVRAPSWDGAVFLDHIRNDYKRGESKIFFRRILEGY